MKNGKNIRGALSYNETKVRAGNAELILAARFGCDTDKLSFSQKLKRFDSLNQNCTRSGYNTVHISLNFHSKDNPDNKQMQEIAQDYMQQLGFEKQPYLVYRHDDAGHPHLHIVTTPVKANGRTINLHNLVQLKSEPARKTIEESYQLIKAEGRQQSEGLTPIDSKKVQYGKTETKQGISQVVRNVADNYRFTSIEEFNLILRQYNVFADMGQPGTRMHQHGGLQYFLLDAKGVKVGVPIKASSIYTKPILKNLDAKFERNRLKKAATQKFTTSVIQFAYAHAKDKNGLVNMLHEKKISISYKRSGELVFIDHRNKTVNTAAELGIEKDLHFREFHRQDQHKSLLEKLFEPEYNGSELSIEFLKKKRKKKR